MRKRVFVVFLSFILCFNIFVNSVFAVVGIDDVTLGSSVGLAVAGEVVVKYFVETIVREYCAAAGTDPETTKELALAYKSYLETTDLLAQAQQLVQNPNYWVANQAVNGVSGVLETKARLSVGRALYDLLFDSLRDFVNSHVNNGVVHVGSSGSLDSSGVTYTTDINDVISFLTNDVRSARGSAFYIHENYYPIATRPADTFMYFEGGPDIWGKYIFRSCDIDGNSLGVIVVTENGNGNSVVGDWSLSWFERTPVRIGYAPDSSLFPESVSDNGVDVTIDDDYLDDPDAVKEKFINNYYSTYNVYNPDGTITQTAGIVADIPFETASDGSIVTDENGVPVAVADGSVPWVLDDSEALTRVQTSAETVPDTLTGDTAADQSTVWGYIVSFIRDFWHNLLKTIMSAVRAVLLSIFIPSADDIKLVFDAIKYSFETTFGVSLIDLTTLFGEGNAPQNIYMDFDFLGLALFHIKVVDFDVLVTVVGYFRALIRGILTLWLILYNINQFFILIGAGDLALGHSVDTIAEQKKRPIGFKVD